MELEDWSLTGDWSLFGGQMELLESQNIESLDLTDELVSLLDNSKTAYYSIDNDSPASTDSSYQSPTDVFDDGENLDREYSLTCIEDQIASNIMGVFSNNYIDIKSDLLDIFDGDISQAGDAVGSESAVTLPSFLHNDESSVIIDSRVDYFDARKSSLQMETSTDTTLVSDSREHSLSYVISSISSQPGLPALRGTDCVEVENETDTAYSDVDINSSTSLHENDLLIIEEEMCEDITCEECVDITDCDSAISSDDRDSVLSSSPSFNSTFLSSPANSCLQSRQEISNNLQDRKLRKKEQNKTAALRYRQKKRSEQGIVLSEYALLERRNIELKTRVEQMTQEICYLQKLIDELCP